jgi:anti-sigma factor RsiW
MNQATITDIELNVYLDRELDEARYREIEALIEGTPELKARVALYRADADRIARLHAPLQDLPIPPRLLDAVRRGTAQRRARAPVPVWAGLAAAAVLLLAVWIGPSLRTAPEPLVAEALAVRDGKANVAHEVPAAQLASSEARDATLQSVLHLPVRVPDLERAGFELARMQLFDENTERKSVQLTYRDQKARSFTVYLRGPAGGDRFDLLQHGDLQVCIWQNDSLGVVMLGGDMTAREMLRVATLTYSDLEF